MPLIFGKTSTGLMVPVRVDANGLLSIESLGQVGGAWQKNPLAFGYSGVVKRVASNVALAAGTNVLDDSAVPAGEIWVITNIATRYVGTVATVVIRVEIYDGASGYVLYDAGNLTSSLSVDRQGWWVLPSGYNLRATVFNATLNDDAYLLATGFRVDIDL